MELMSWTPEHSEALRKYLAKGMSYSEVAVAINAKFGTAYSRNATIGRAKRMGLASPDRPAGLPRSQPRASAPRLHKGQEHQVAEEGLTAPALERAEKLKLRCIQIVPRHLSVTDLEPGDCRYPYGGDEDGEAITFCGHSQLQGSSYCAGHFHLTRGPGTASERAVAPVTLRLVEAA